LLSLPDRDRRGIGGDYVKAVSSGGESARRDDVDDAFALENLKQFTDRVLRPDVGRVRFCGEFLHTARRSSSHFVIE
jgi:hypothetical protein